MDIKQVPRRPQNIIPEYLMLATWLLILIQAASPTALLFAKVYPRLLNDIYFLLFMLGILALMPAPVLLAIFLVFILSRCRIGLKLRKVELLQIYLLAAGTIILFVFIPHLFSPEP